MNKHVVLALGLLLLSTQTVAKHNIWSYEANNIGVTQDGNRDSYLDFNLSVLYPLSQNSKHSPHSTGLFFAFLWSNILN